MTLERVLFIAAVLVGLVLIIRGAITSHRRSCPNDSTVQRGYESKYWTGGR